VSLDPAAIAAVGENVDLIELDDALAGLERVDPRKSQVVELRFFGGLTGEEMAEVLDVSKATVERDWVFARTWLRRELSGGRKRRSTVRSRRRQSELSFGAPDFCPASASEL
jgi:DNA-directed RNA polymerase specialized sigma24 family protein